MLWNLFRSSARTARAHKRRPTRRPALEALETRLAPAVNVLSYHVDAGYTGANTSETALTPADVNSGSFGKLFSTVLDGQVYAQPLLVTGVNITTGSSQGIHNVVYVATEHDSLYAIDADNGVVLWKDSFLTSGLSGAMITTVPSSEVGSTITVEIGVTGTPVIDASTGTLYVVATTKEVVGTNKHYVQRLHAVSLSDGSEKLGGPATIADTSYTGSGSTYTYNSGPYVNGTGAGSVGGKVYYNAFRQSQRPALTLAGGVIYVASASHSDHDPYHGWILGYDASTLQLKAAFNDTPNGTRGGLWASGAGLSVDPDGNLYVETGNGTFDTSLDGNGFPVNGDYGDSVLKLAVDTTTSQDNQGKNGWGLQVVDYFTPFNQASLESQDLDLGSCGVLLLPDVFGSAAHPHLLVAEGKEGRIYLIDRDNMGKFNSAADDVVQSIAGVSGPDFDTPALFGDSVYFFGNGNRGKALTLTPGAAQFSTSASSQTPDSFNFPGGNMETSGDGSGNGVVWALATNNQLRAYDANNLATELYTSGQAANGRDAIGSVVKFSTPTVANGRVYVGTSNSLVVYGLFAPVLDAGFEDPDVGTGTWDSFQYDPSGSAWTFDNGSGVAGNGSGFTAGNPDAPEGTQVAFLQATGSFSQSVAFAAGTYRISFSAAQRANYQASSQTFEVLVDGTVVGTFTPGSTNYATYTTGNFTVTAGSHTITFIGTDPDGQDNTALIDQVRVTLVGRVSDAGFEQVYVGTGTWDSFQYDPSGSAWTFDNGSGVAGNGSGFTAGNPDAPEGTQVAFLQATGSFSQSVTFAAGTYSLSFFAAQRGNGNASSQTFEVLVDGVVYGTFTPTDANYASYTTNSFMVTAGNHTIKFVGTDPDGQDNTALIDEVGINQLS